MQKYTWSVQKVSGLIFSSLGEGVQGGPHGQGLWWGMSGIRRDLTELPLSLCRVWIAPGVSSCFVVSSKSRCSERLNSGMRSCFV